MAEFDSVNWWVGGLAPPHAMTARERQVPSKVRLVLMGDSATS
jgi:hypothetical protein